MSYNNLEWYLGNSWLRNNPNHIYNLWMMKSEDHIKKTLELSLNLKTLNI
jgi:hypothetical protein